MNKEELIRNALFAGFSLGGLYFINGKKYINLSSFLLLGFANSIAKTIIIVLQKNNAGGTTPYNPLKIPSKKITPAHKI